MLFRICQLWGFVRPYRGQFFLDLLCEIFYKLTNGALLAAANVVMDLIFQHGFDVHTKLANAPHLVQPLTQWLAGVLPEKISAPTSPSGLLLVVGIIPAVMLLRVTLAYLSIYLTNWSAMHAIADIRTKLFAHLQNLSLGWTTSRKPSVQRMVTGSLTADANELPTMP